MSRVYPLPLLTVLCGTLCAALTTGCSAAGDKPATAAGGPAAAPAAKAPAAVVVPVDSLYGIPGHRFGEPLSAFPGLVPADPGPEGTKRYTYPVGKPGPGWFGKRKKEFPDQIYSSYLFLDGKFVLFSAIAYGPMRGALRTEAGFLYGAIPTPVGDVGWNGKLARAVYVEVMPYSGNPFGLGAQLVVLSQAYSAREIQQKADWLKKENAQ